MKARLVPVYFDPGRDSGFDEQVAVLKSLLGGKAELLEPVALGRPLPEAEAVVFPQILGEAYRRVDDFRAIRLPILLIASECGTLSMWDWEIISYLRSEGIETIAPYDLGQTQKLCAALRVKRELNGARFLVFQDNPGEGAQASIFKRFYWWEDECTRRIREAFGVAIVKRSFRELGTRAKQIADDEADEVWKRRSVPAEGVSPKQVRGAVKLYLAVKRELDADPGIRAVGINCLNESHFCDTTPCLAWEMLYQDRRLIWGCEGDTLSMLSAYVLHHSLGVPIMMTNLYPFLLGMAALKHERIDRFPDVPVEPENHVLVAHCGYMGVIPTSFATQWTLRPKVLAIVDDNATAIDARFPVGDVTLAKLGPSLRRITVAEGELTGYAQYPDSDSLNAGIIRVRDGHRLMASLTSHHYLVTAGHNLVDIRLMAKVFGLQVEEI